jgi:predicted RNA binding protein YcfA (HicA-like mRNA interferase family)
LARLRVMSGRDACAILARHSFVQTRQKGSHIVMQRLTGGGTTTVVVPDHAELKTGTPASIIQQSGLERKEFES